MDRRRDHRAGDAEPFRDVPFHLGTEHQLRLQLGDRAFHVQVVVGDQCLDAVGRRTRLHLARHLATVCAQSDHLEAQLFACDACGRDHVRAVAEDEDTLAREVRRIDRTRIPRHARLTARERCRTRHLATQHRRHVDRQHAAHFGDEVTRRTDTDRDRRDRRHLEGALQPPAGAQRNLRIQADVRIGVGQAAQVVRIGTERCADMHIHADAVQKLRDLGDVVAAPETQDRAAQQIHARPAAFA